MKIGDFVTLIHSDEKGQISKEISSKKVEVILENGFKITTEIFNLKLTEKPTNKKESISKKSFSIGVPPPSVDLHIEKLVDNYKRLSNGEKLEIQLRIFEQNLDAALAAGMFEIRFIHGIGSGVLRNEIRKILKENKQVKSFADGNFDKGSTVVKFY